MASVTVKYVLAAALATALGCRSASSPTAPSAVVPAPDPVIEPASTTVRSATVPASNAGVPGVDRFNVATLQSGTATVTLRWPNADFSLQLYLTRGECHDTASLLTGRCTVLGTTRPGTLPGVITSTVTSGDEITIWVLNPDNDPQAFTVDVTVK